ncbi:MAG TPA: arylesterase [Candidatus Methylomirabilis sp.]|nr:arylesterase [Candidatus Methylomirabilis sp.]HSB79092.1 arylesterase [Candidatus Methylomirabilis sp.]
MRKRFLLLGLTLWVILAAAGCGRESPPPERRSEPDFEGTIVAVGDSLTAGQGVEEELAYPALLEQKLASAGLRYKVINAGISGETSSGTLSRINWILTLKPDIVILETGANDGLRGIDPALMSRNLQEIIRVLQGRNVSVILAGMQMVQNLGREYTATFRRVYPEAAREFGILLIPFFLEGVAGKPALNQADGIHPTAEGYKIVAETVYPYVVKVIQQHRKGTKVR